MGFSPHASAEGNQSCHRRLENCPARRDCRARPFAVRERIAGQLGITATTVAVHRKHIRQKLELHNDRELVGYARKWGLDMMIATDDAKYRAA